MSLEERALRALKIARWTLATAESLTGGLVAARITRVPGSGDAFLGGVVTYHDDAKVELLGVDRKLLREKGAVSREVARQMAEGARERLGADVAVSLTGFAGPDVPPGGEMGLVYVGVASWQGVEVHEMRFGPTRDDVREQAVEAALGFVLKVCERAT